jgi:hypothetical protein
MADKGYPELVSYQWYERMRNTNPDIQIVWFLIASYRRVNLLHYSGRKTILRGIGVDPSRPWQRQV